MTVELLIWAFLPEEHAREREEILAALPGEEERIMAAKSNNSKNTKNKARGHRTGNGSETLRMDDTGEEEDDMEVGWTQIEGRSGKKESKKRKKGKEEGSESTTPNQKKLGQYGKRK